MTWLQFIVLVQGAAIIGMALHIRKVQAKIARLHGLYWQDKTDNSWLMADLKAFLHSPSVYIQKERERRAREV